MKINLSNLVPICELIIKKANQKEINELDLNIDFYWSIDPDDLYDIKQTRPKTMINSLEDDWEGLQNILNGQDPVVTYDFIRLANLMKLVAGIIIFADDLQ